MGEMNFVARPKKSFEKYAFDLKTFRKICRNLKAWFCKSNSDTFLSVSRDQMHIFLNLFY